jgi:hypothetical protein
VVKDTGGGGKVFDGCFGGYALLEDGVGIDVGGN